MQATGRLAPLSTGLRAEPAIALAAGAQPLLLAVDALAGGGHAVAWLNPGGALAVQRFDAAGQPEAEPARWAIDASRGTPAAAVLPDGSVVVAAVAGGIASVDTP